MSIFTKKKGLWGSIAAAAGALALIFGVALPAQAATISLFVDNGVSATPDPIYTGGTGTHVLDIDGENFNPDPFDRAPGVGFYIGFGDQFSRMNPAVYYDSIWVHVPPVTPGDEFELDPLDGSFSNATLDISSTVNGNDCKTSPTDTSGVQCYVFFLSAHGSNDTSNDNTIPVYFG